MLRCEKTTLSVPHVSIVIMGGSSSVRFVTVSPLIAAKVTKYGGYRAVEMYSATWYRNGLLHIIQINFEYWMGPCCTCVLHQRQGKQATRMLTTT